MIYPSQPSRSTPIYSFILSIGLLFFLQSGFSQEAAKAAVAKISSPMDTSAVYRIITEELPGKSLGIGMSATQANTINAMMMPTKNNSEQEWKLVSTGNGYYRMVNQYYPTKSLEVVKSGADQNSVILSNSVDADTQYWKIFLTPYNTYQITSMAVGNTRPLGFVPDEEESSDVMLRENNSTLWTFVRKKSTAPVVKKESIAKVESKIETNVERKVEKAEKVENKVESKVESKVDSKVESKTAEIVKANSGVKDRLAAGEELRATQQLTSANGKYSFVQQADGNLVLYDEAKKPMWASNTNGKSVYRCVMQKDGNLVQYLLAPVAVWSTNTQGNAGAYLVVQDDGNVVVYSKDSKPLWSTKTNQRK